MSNSTVSVTATVLGIAASLVFGAGIVRSVVAQPGPSSQGESMREAPAAAGSSAPTLGMEQILDKLAAQGYTDIREIEREHEVYEVKARGPDGRMVELYLSPTTGDILRSEPEHR
jgi:hypothetical protein